MSEWLYHNRCEICGGLFWTVNGWASTCTFCQPKPCKICGGLKCEGHSNNRIINGKYILFEEGRK